MKDNPQPTSDIVYVPACDLWIAPENPRSSQSLDLDLIDILSKNIAANGILTPLIGYHEIGEHGDEAMITAGGRRTRAIKKLIEDGVWPATYQVPVRLMERDEAVMAGRAEQLTHVKLSDMDEFRVFASPEYESVPDETLARYLGRSLTYVQQRRLMLKLPQEVIDATFREEISVSQAAGLTYFLDHAVTLMEWFERCKRNTRITSDDLRRAFLNMADIWENNRNAQIVSKEEYEAAGGRFQTDLFSTETFVLDPQILEEIATRKIPEVVAAAHPGYAAYVQVDDLYRAQRHPGVPRKLTKKEEKRVLEIQQRMLDIDEIDEINDELQEEADRLAEELDELQQMSYPDELKALLEIHYTRPIYGKNLWQAGTNILPKDLEPLYEAGFLERPAPKTKEEQAAEAQSEIPAVHTARIRWVKRWALMQELSKKPDDIITLWLESEQQQYHPHFRNMRDFWPEIEEELQVTVTPAKQFSDMVEADMTPASQILTLKPAQRVKMVAYKMLRAISESHPETRTLADEIIRQWFTPDEWFLSRYKTDQLKLMWHGVFGADESAPSKKAELVDALAAHALADKHWLPMGF